VGTLASLIEGRAGLHPARTAAEFIAKSIKLVVGSLRGQTLYIEPGSPWRQHSGRSSVFSGELPRGVRQSLEAVLITAGTITVRGSEDDLPTCRAPDAPIEEEARRRMEAGADLWRWSWMARQLRLACWIFRDRYDDSCADSQLCCFPPEIVCLGSVTSAAYRSRGGSSCRLVLASRMSSNREQGQFIIWIEVNTPSRRELS